MPLRYWTLFTFAACLIIFIVYDSVMAAVSGRNTLSWITAQWAIKHTISVFCVGMALGIIIGHLFFYQNPLGKP
jgi:hypothetical protein